MSFWKRIANVFRGDRLNREIDEEFEAHIADAIENGRSLAEARRAFGSTLRHRETSRDVRALVWLDSLRADAVYGWRQLLKRRATSAAAILSLALAIGSCTSAFRLIDAMLLRPLPVANPERLYYLSRLGVSPEGKPSEWDSWAYPAFRLMRTTAKGQAELIAVSDIERTDLTYGSDEEMEKPYVQYVSGWMFDDFGVRPALGRLFHESDDITPRASPYAVISYDYWTRRFGRDPQAIGRSFRMGDDLYQIVGVAAPRFTGTEPGTFTDIFVPTMMHPLVTRDDATWMRSIAHVRPDTALESLRQKWNAVSYAFEENRAKSSTMPRQRITQYLNQTVVLRPAMSGVSGMQRNLRLPLAALGVLVGLVLLIACTNIANLMTAQAAARVREMALRVSIGAGRLRLVQLVLVESALLALLASAAGGAFAWWSTPLVVRGINPPDNPARIDLPADLRVLGFGLALTLCVTLLFGLVPALRASAVKPASSLKGGDGPQARGRLMRSLIAVQVAFCFLVMFIASLFVATSQRLANLPTGFSSNRILVMETVTSRPQDPGLWDQVAADLRTVPGVEAVALADWALLNDNSRNNFISIEGAQPTPNLVYFRYIAPGWLEVMKVGLKDGRDFRANDTAPGAAIVNEAFARTFFDGRDPVGKWFGRGASRYQIVGLVGDVTYRSLREPILPIAFVPFHAMGRNGAAAPVGEGAFVIRTSAADPMVLSQALRREVARARPGFRVSNALTQLEINQRQTVRERLLATLSLFFACVSLLLAGIGLYGVLDYSVLQRRREIGIRMAIGAQVSDIARRFTAEVSITVLAGAAAGVAFGMLSVRYIETLLYGVKGTDPGMLAPPAIAILLAAFVAALPAVVRAIRTDPMATLRSE